MGLIARKPVFGVSDKASFKPTQVNRMCRSRRVLATGGKQTEYGWTGSVSIFISYREFLGDESSKQVASLLNDKDSDCVKCF